MGRAGTNADCSGSFVAESNLHAVNAVDSGIAGRGAAEIDDARSGDEAHMHQVVLDIFREVERDQDPTFTDGQFAQHAHLSRSPMLPAKRQHSQNTTRLVVFEYTTKRLRAANWIFEDFGRRRSHDLTSGDGRGRLGWGIPQTLKKPPGGPFNLVHRNDDVFVAVVFSVKCDLDHARWAGWPGF